MASNIPIEVVDDDDEFDWEAAAREIDVACQDNQKPSTSVPLNSSSHCAAPVDSSVLIADSKNSLCSNDGKKPAKRKQSTLDKFISKGDPKAPPDNWMVEEPHQESVQGDEKVAYVDIDAEAAKTWIYPVNVPLRDYQLAITKSALFSNTLVALPTGLGKTLIAAVVMYNYFRWFPAGKIVFAAPSRPLVLQQIEACHNIVGIPQEWTIDLTGQVNPTKRAFFWKSKRVFFVTPQVLERDIQSGTCLAKYLVCLVIDEAHRALGNYSYCVAVRELMAIPVQLRILALTATPGWKHQAIQDIIDNLHISMLEYRNEDDHDVSPYVQSRKMELIEVPLGQDVIAINNRLLEVIRPYVAKLYSIGLIHNRDYQTLSPCDLLMSRDKFRQAPPSNLPHVRHGDVESCFAALITLYHIRKLLSSHGIRPAYEMLEDKLQHGSFARLMSKNEDIRKAKILMERSLSHGAPSPKLSKMLDILVDHFKINNPQSSRVIIFSNFRGSVRDIMNTLTNIGDVVKATEFIGQSSGKALKGQSQKVQQAVLEKFRAGGYNVIVATSIGEEGLDIMEVDLVICFDANVSPLRMIQRMGRTGRKHDGRVVVLACEGSELKGYMKKQANGRAMRKHMRNGGMNSFGFHSSPRMLPHVFKPEVQFIELSIQKFIPRGKKLKNEEATQSPLLKDKLTVAEADLIAKYFPPARENIWRPSLIAFPYSQAFPSKVHKVMHSYRTGMLIDSMQCLQGLSFFRDSTNFSVEDEAPSDECLKVQIDEQLGSGRKDTPSLDDTSVIKLQRRLTDYEASPMGPVRTAEKYNIADFHVWSPPSHSYLFGSDFVSVGALGKVLILSVPSLPFKEVPHSRCTDAAGTVFPNSAKEDSCNFNASGENHNTMHSKASETRCMKGDTHSVSAVCKSGFQQRKMLDGLEEVPETNLLKTDVSNEGDSNGERVDIVEIKVTSGGSDFIDPELSPRLTNLIKSGIVPESPVSDSGILKSKRRDEFVVPNLSSPARFHTELLSKSSSPEKSEKDIRDSSQCARSMAVPSTADEIQTPLPKMNHVTNMRKWTFASPVAEACQTPLANITNSTGSKDWCLTSREKSDNVIQARKFKRLRKVGDCVRNNSPKSIEEISVIPVANLARSFSGSSPIWMKHVRGQKKPVNYVKAFIDEEAEVSSEAESEDDNDLGNNSYDDSFIDDRTNPTASTQVENSRFDMMAIYRRSLLSQSPVDWQPSCSATSSPDCVASIPRVNGGGGYPGKSFCSLRTPPIKSMDESARISSESPQVSHERDSLDARRCITTEFSREGEGKTESRKRKLSFCHSGPVLPNNLEQQLLQPEVACKESVLKFEAVAKGDPPDDDQFYESLDLDAVEEQATFALRHKAPLSTQTQEVLQPNVENCGLQGSPSFDLGIW